MITILCNGSRGDIQPYVALALEIKKQGGKVRVVTGKSFKDYVESYGVDFLPLSADYKSIDLDPKFIEDAQSSDNPLKMLLVFNKMKKYASFVTEEMYDLCDGSDVIVYHPGCTIGYFVAENMGIPSVLASPFPMHRTKERASVVTYGRFKLPNKLTYKLLQGMLWMISKTNVVSFFKKKFGELPKGFGCPFERVDEKHPSIISCSNHVFSRPSDWNTNIYQSGYWFLNENKEYNPDKKLKDFLDKGEKPIYFGFGSVFNEKQKYHVFNIIKKALDNSGKRGIISGMGNFENLPDNIITIGSVPHTWLFKKVAAVCHHGGAGTTAAGFSAGVPSIIVPFSNDQFAWAHRSYELGVGSESISRKKLTESALTKAIKYALSEEVKVNAKNLSEKMANENGLMDCTRIIIDLDKGKGK
ncbi:glycosyltransferase [Clostridium oceanicum]|uniref:Glycosyltransferase n=1 Tax=Clostridium oceanicum TaxID=1543 RepID=A0ABN1JKZ0_9CLOT